MCCALEITAPDPRFGIADVGFYNLLTCLGMPFFSWACLDMSIPKKKKLAISECRLLTCMLAWVVKDSLIHALLAHS